MAESVVICEKPSQAKDIIAAVGTQYGEVLPAQGHIIKLAEPEDVDPRYKDWGSFLTLVPPDGFYPLRADNTPNSGKPARLAKIREALKGCRRVIIATDCDREGELIGREILQFLNFRGEVLRAVFTAQDKKTLQAAFKNLKPASDYENLYQAAFARQQADQIYNLSLTRAATKAWRPPGAKGAIGIGRVKTIVQAMVCQRELEIKNFKAVDYFELTAQANTAKGAIPMRYAPTDPKLTDKARAELIRSRAEGNKGPLTVAVTDESEAPPKPLDLVEMQKQCSAKFGWNDTLAVAQTLYEKHLITYPRGESRYLSESMIEQAEPLLKAVGTLLKVNCPDKPVVRTGKNGVFSDAGLNGASHHAVIINVNTIGEWRSLLPGLDENEKKLFMLIAKTTLAMLLPDHLYRQTIITMPVAVAPGDSVTFRASGRVTTSPGWRAVYEASDEDADEEDAEEGKGKLPDLANGEPAQLSGVKVTAKKTKPPKRYTQGTLIGDMKDAWKFIPTGSPLRERLKDAKGIGTPATRETVIDGLIKQKILERSKKNIVPTEMGLKLYQLLKEHVPRLVEVAITAIWEAKLDLILEGKLTARQMVDEIAGETTKLVSAIQARVGNDNLPGGKPGLVGDAPTPGRLAFAKKLAEHHGLTLPEEAKTNWRKLTEWVQKVEADKGKLPEGAGGGSAPSPAKLAFAEKLATENNIALPEECRTDWKKCGAFIDKYAKKGGGKAGGKAGGSKGNSKFFKQQA